MMSKYPAWWNTTITIYNRYENPSTQAITWYRTVLKNCFWKQGLQTVYIGTDTRHSADTTDTIMCRIPKNSKYLNPYAWRMLSASDMAKKFTLQSGDIIIKGNVSDTINEYAKGSRATDLLEKYKDYGTIKINIVEDNSDNARNLPHYRVSEWRNK